MPAHRKLRELRRVANGILSPVTGAFLSALAALASLVALLHAGAP